MGSIPPRNNRYRYSKAGWQPRPHEKYGPIRLSVQASEYSYCSPRVIGGDLGWYRSVEIALYDKAGKLCRPSALGIKGFDKLFDEGDTPIAGYVPQAEVEQLREALRRRAKRKLL